MFKYTTVKDAANSLDIILPDWYKKINIKELEAKLQEEKTKLEALRNPEIGVTLSKSDWKIVVRTLQTVTFAGSPIAVIAETVDKQIGEQA